MTLARIACWNVAWHGQTSKRGKLANAHLESTEFDVAVISETNSGNDLGCHMISGGTSWGYPISVASRRKIALLSRNPWKDTVCLEGARPLAGRYVSGTTTTPAGEVRVVGVCIPWFACHVSTGARDRKNWEEYESFLKAVEPQLRAERDTALPLIVAGDFNMPIPHHSGKPPQAYHQLLELLGRVGLEVVTSAQTVPSGKPRLLNHISVHDLQTHSVTTWSNVLNDMEVTDHAGALAELARP